MDAHKQLLQNEAAELAREITVKVREFKEKTGLDVLAIDIVSTQGYNGVLTGVQITTGIQTTG